MFRTTRIPFFGFLSLSFFLPASCLAQANLFCQGSVTNPLVRSEGLAEKLSDIVLQCSQGTPGFIVSGNISVLLSAPITNRLTPGTTGDILLTIDTGSGPVPATFGGAVLLSPPVVSLNGVTFTVPPSGNVTIRISNLRGSIANNGVGQPVSANLSLNSLSTASLTNNSQLIVGTAQRGLLGNSSSAVIRCVGSPVPATIGLSNFFAAGTHFESTRLTEGFASAFQPKGALESAGTRFLLSYKNVPAGVLLWVPDVIAGSDALQPTAGGDLGARQAGGQYAPGSNTLLLARVQGADATGNGGSPVYTPPAAGPAVAFDSATQLPISNGSAYAVYEVMDAGNTARENAQFPTFVGVASTGASAGTAQESVSFAPVSSDSTANSSAPIPRFAAVQPPSDCQAVGDCNANYFPLLSVFAQPMAFTAIAGGLALQPPGYIAVQNGNAATSVLNWTASVTYQSGSGWLTLETNAGLNNGSVRVFASALNLAAGTYNATVTIDAGVAGTKSIPVTLLVTALPPNPPPTPAVTPPGIASITNAANFLPGPVVQGSLATIKGTHFSGKSVAVTFDGIAAKILFSNDTQINLQVPDGLGGKTSAQVVVTVDGTSSPATSVPLAAVAPAIFNNGILNQDSSPNTATTGAAVGSVVQIFLTGLPEATGTVLVKIHDREDLVPLYAGPAPGLAGVQQVNAQVPADLPAMTTTTLVCGLDAAGRKVCSAAAPITLSDAQQ